MYWPPLAWAAQAQSSGGQPQVQLQFRIHIPQILSLQIVKEERAAEMVDFRVTEIPEAGRIFGDVKDIRVRVAGFLPRGQAVILTADSALPLGAKSHAIPLSSTSRDSTGEFPKSGVTDATCQRSSQGPGAGQHQDTCTFVDRSFNSYKYYTRGAYSGSVTYTLSVP